MEHQGAASVSEGLSQRDNLSVAPAYRALLERGSPHALKLKCLEAFPVHPTCYCQLSALWRQTVLVLPLVWLRPGPLVPSIVAQGW